MSDDCAGERQSRQTTVSSVPRCLTVYATVPIASCSMAIASGRLDLFLNRKRRKLALVHNQTDVPFVTGHQPAINLKANGVGAPEKNLAIYYPISPQLALVLGDVDETSEFPAEGLTPAQASMLNQNVFKASYKQVFAQTEESLRAVTSHE
jgi:hypothetical protein